MKNVYKTTVNRDGHAVEIEKNGDGLYTVRSHNTFVVATIHPVEDPQTAIEQHLDHCARLRAEALIRG